MSSIRRILLDIVAAHTKLIHVNRPAHTSIAAHVRRRIEVGGADRLWTYSDFEEVTDRMALAAALSRLARSSFLKRVRRGVYYRPKATLFGVSTPDPTALVDAVLRARGVSAVPSGIGEYHRLGLTTQMSGAVTRATAVRVPRDLLASVAVRARTRPLRDQPLIRADERTVLDALRDIRAIPDAAPADAIRRILALLRAGRLNYGRLARFGLAEPPRVRAILGAIGDELRNVGTPGVSARAIARLRAGINPLTRFVLPGAAEGLPHAAKAWHLVNSERSVQAA